MCYRHALRAMESSGKDGLELDCWGAACTALATIAPRWGITPAEVRELCEQGASSASHDLEAAQLMAVALIQGIASAGADPDALVHAAQDAYQAHRRLDARLTPSDLF